MRITRAQARALNLGRLLEPPAGARDKPADGMNGLERSFRDQILAPAWNRGAIENYWREPIKLRLAGRTWYSPDFLALLPGYTGRPFVFVEVKGHMRDDAAVKLKVAASLYPFFGWYLVFRQRRAGWIVHAVGTGGIAARPTGFPWEQG